MEPFASTEEQQLARSFEQGIRSAINQQAAEKLAEELDYLPGEDATRAKIDLILHPKLFYQLGIDVSKVFGSRETASRSFRLCRHQSAIPHLLRSQSPSNACRTATEPSSPKVTCCVPSGKVDPRKAALTAEYTPHLAQSMSSHSEDYLVHTALTVFENDTRAKAA